MLAAEENVVVVALDVGGYPISSCISPASQESWGGVVTLWRCRGRRGLCATRGPC